MRFFILFLIIVHICGTEARAQNPGTQSSIQAECNNLFVASQFATREEMVSTLADKLATEYPILYSERFRQLVLKALETEFGFAVDRNKGNQEYKSVQIRKQLSDIQIDRPRYKTNLAAASKSVWASIAADFSAFSPLDAVKSYSIKKKDFEKVKQLIASIDANNELKGPAHQLVEGAIFNSLKLLKTATRVKKLAYNTQSYNDGPRAAPTRMWPLIFLYPSAYRYLYYSTVYNAVKKSGSKKAVAAVIEGKAGIELDNGIQNNLVLQQPVAATYADIAARISKVPSSGYLANPSSIASYEQEFSGAYFELSLKALTDKEQFSNPYLWNRSIETLKAQMVRFQFDHSGASAVLISLNRLKLHIKNYRLSLKEQLWALTSVFSTLQKSLIEVEARRMEIVEPLNPLQQLSRNIESNFGNSLLNTKSDAEAMQAYIQDSERRCEAALGIIRSLELELNPITAKGLTPVQIQATLAKMRACA